MAHRYMNQNRISCQAKNIMNRPKPDPQREAPLRFAGFSAISRSGAELMIASHAQRQTIIARLDMFAIAPELACAPNARVTETQKNIKICLTRTRFRIPPKSYSMKVLARITIFCKSLHVFYRTRRAINFFSAAHSIFAE
jgi:hypothetical protein